MTQIKIFIIEDIDGIEKTINDWLRLEPDIEVHQINPMPLMDSSKHAALMFIVIYSKEGWK